MGLRVKCQEYYHAPRANGSRKNWERLVSFSPEWIYWSDLCSLPLLNHWINSWCEMNTQTLGCSDLVSSRLSYGCMRIAGTWNPAEITPEREVNARNALLSAYEAGYNLFDHADIYCRGGCEMLHGRLIADSPDLRRATQIATKCGIRFKGVPNPEDPGRYDFSKDWIIESCEGSLKRLQVERIDLYQLHRPDILMNPLEVADAFTQLHEQGKVRWFGVSNFLPSHVDMLQSVLKFPLIVNQVEVSLKRLDCFVDGTLDQCISMRITPLSWSPLGGGMLGTAGQPREADLRNIALLKAIDAMAESKGVSRAVIALAFLLKHPSKIVPIVGSTKPESIKECTLAHSLELTREDWYTLYIAARGEPMP